MACAARSARKPGLDIEPDALTGVYKNMPRGIIALVFRCKITGGHLATNDEVTAFRWADEADIRQLTSEAYAVRLLDALREGTTPAIRQHDGIDLLELRPSTRCICAALPNLAVLDQGGACGAAGPASAPGSALGGPPGARRATSADAQIYLPQASRSPVHVAVFLVGPLSSSRLPRQGALRASHAMASPALTRQPLTMVRRLEEGRTGAGTPCSPRLPSAILRS